MDATVNDNVHEEAKGANSKIDLILGDRRGL